MNSTRSSTRTRVVLFAAIGLMPFGQVIAQLSTRSTQQGIMVSDGETPVMFYQTKLKSQDGRWPRNHYVHPLYDLDGNVMTEDFPGDHGHHRGVFWAWHQVWVGQQQLGDPWICKDFQWSVGDVKSLADQAAQRIESTVLWRSSDYCDAAGVAIPIVREKCSMLVHDATPTHRMIDFEINLLALVEGVRIGGSNDVKGYGGFSPRIALNDEQKFLSAGGELDPQITAVTASGWVNITDSRRGLAILVHDDNPEPRDRWILRRRRSMQNAQYPGREPVALSTQEPTVLRYRLVIHRGSLTAEQLAGLLDDFNASEGRRDPDESAERPQD